VVEPTLVSSGGESQGCARAPSCGQTEDRRTPRSSTTASCGRSRARERRSSLSASSSEVPSHRRTGRLFSTQSGRPTGLRAGSCHGRAPSVSSDDRLTLTVLGACGSAGVFGMATAAWKGAARTRRPRPPGSTWRASWGFARPSVARTSRKPSPRPDVSNTTDKRLQVMRRVARRPSGTPTEVRRRLIRRMESGSASNRDATPTQSDRCSRGWALTDESGSRGSKRSTHWARQAGGSQGSPK
jgi:hypothetical protein